MFVHFYLSFYYFWKNPQSHFLAINSCFDRFVLLFLFVKRLFASFLSPRQVLKGSKKLNLSVRSVGRIPGGYVTNHVYTWVDPQGRSVSPPPDLPEHRSATLRRTDSQRRSNMQLLQEGDEKKVETFRGGPENRSVLQPVELEFTCQEKQTVKEKPSLCRNSLVWDK